MDKRSMRTLGIGFISASLLLYSANELTGESADENTLIEETDVILSNEEYETLQQELTEWEDRALAAEEAAAAEETPAEETAEGEAPATTRFILSIESGMTTPDIRDLLVEYELIEDNGEFEQYLTDNDLTDQIQIGQYDLNSSMTPQEIAEMITQ
ncbi:hypothetical protein [Jeotgalibacillus aurantiacus]|uniref:hypothetical protein n=1 Tax=Jeotgalibacillus aurantiacus TaxID=2763266 RepID=UPI001D0B71BB|nr:hypothetical protein [Jeotgalibacillus aurantiacus]